VRLLEAVLGELKEMKESLEVLCSKTAFIERRQDAGLSLWSDWSRHRSQAELIEDPALRRAELKRLARERFQAVSKGGCFGYWQYCWSVE
jgi:hypothetical protein